MDSCLVIGLLSQTGMALMTDLTWEKRITNHGRISLARILSCLHSMSASTSRMDLGGIFTLPLVAFGEFNKESQSIPIPQHSCSGDLTIMPFMLAVFAFA